MADRVEERVEEQMEDQVDDHNDSQPSGRRKIRPQQQYSSQHTQPGPPLSDFAYDQAYAQPAMLGYQNVENDVLMEDVYQADAAFWLGVSENKKEGSMTTATTSFVNVGTPSAITDGVNSYEMVRSYSGNSNETSGQGSNDSSYSTSDPANPFEYSMGAEFRIDADAMEEDARAASLVVPQDQKLLLGSLYSSGEHHRAFTSMSTSADGCRTTNCGRSISAIPRKLLWRRHRSCGKLHNPASAIIPLLIAHKPCKVAELF